MRDVFLWPSCQSSCLLSQAVSVFLFSLSLSLSMSSVVKRNVAAAAPPAPPRDDVEAGYEAAVRPSGDQRSAHLVVAFVLAVAAVVIIVELFVMLSQQQQSFEKAVLEVERMHHGGQLDPAHHQALSSLSRNPLHGNSEFDAAMHEKIAVAEDHRPYFALLDNDDAIMSKVKEMFTNMGYRQLHPWQDYIGKWEVCSVFLVVVAFLCRVCRCCGRGATRTTRADGRSRSRRATFATFS